jgi:hypothetical protein
MLNLFISYIYSPSLDSSIYDGFLYQRGSKSWWETVLWSSILSTYHWILEVDLSSGFPNLSLLSVREALESDGLIPTNIINLILTHLNSPLVESPSFPTLETFIENFENRNWRDGPRSVHMGLGISPILFVITQRWILNQLSLLRIRPGEFTYKWYADDGSFYFNTQWLYTFYRESGRSIYYILTLLFQGHNPIVTILNEHPKLQSAGIKFCPKKSSIVRMFGLWLKPYKSLGLSLYTTKSYWIQFKTLILLGSSYIPLDLRGSTRGRGMNPKTGKSSTLPSHTKLEYWNKTRSSCLNLRNLILHYKPYFGLLMSKLYSPGLTIPSSSVRLQAHPQSLLGELLKSKVNKSLPSGQQLTLYNSSSHLTKLLINLHNQENNDLVKFLPSLKKTLKDLSWSINDTDILTESIKPPKLSTKYIDNPTGDYFKKFSEIELTTEELTFYKDKYNALPLRPKNRTT